jgi:hypothetical protein
VNAAAGRLSIDDVVTPRAQALGEPHRVSLLLMATLGLPRTRGPVIGLDGMGHQLRAAVSLGRRLYEQHMDSRGTFELESVADARRYRLHFAWSMRVLGTCTSIIEAERRVGIRDEHGNVREAWR